MLHVMLKDKSRSNFTWFSLNVRAWKGITLRNVIKAKIKYLVIEILWRCIMACFFAESGEKKDHSCISKSQCTMTLSLSHYKQFCHSGKFKEGSTVHDIRFVQR